MQRDLIPSVLLNPEDERCEDWAALLGSVGTDSFERVLRRFLRELVGSRACISFSHEAVGRVMECRRFDTVETQEMEHNPCACRANPTPNWIYFDGGLAVSLSGSFQWMNASALSSRLSGSGRALSAIVDLHHKLVSRLSTEGEPLSDLKTIEECLSRSTSLPPREVEVCARILIGVSSAGIAVDLNLCEGTVKTYRKRAYQRLSIGSERELIGWYLRTWTRWRQVAIEDSKLLSLA
jgi:DNA-binding CsgD family transcriptional regulator